MKTLSHRRAIASTRGDTRWNEFYFALGTRVEGQFDDEGRPLSQVRVDAELAAVALDDPVGE